MLLLKECILSQSRLRVLRAFRTRPCSGTSEWKQWNQPVGRTVQVRLASLKEEREQEEALNLQLLFAHERSKVGLLACISCWNPSCQFALCLQQILPAYLQSMNQLICCRNSALQLTALPGSCKAPRGNCIHSPVVVDVCPDEGCLMNMWSWYLQARKRLAKSRATSTQLAAQLTAARQEIARASHLLLLLNQCN